MDKKRSVLNVSVSILSRLVLLGAALLVRRLLIRQIGNDVNGLNSLYTSILGMLAVAELGVGRAIVYSMYKPIIQGDHGRIAALYGLYKRLYRIIGGVILLAGLAVMPFLPRLISDYDRLQVNVPLTFLLTLVSVVLTYLYGAKTALIVAHKDNYVATGIFTIAGLARYALQAAAILLWSSFPLFLVCQILGTLAVWVMTESAVRRKYADILCLRETVDADSKSEIVRNVKAMFLHKVGTVLVNSVDSMIISGFIGVAILGKYSNYTYVAGVMVGTISLFFTPLTSVVGHLCAEGDRNRSKSYFDYFYCLNYVLGVVFFLGYFGVIDSVIALLFGAGLEVSRPIAFIITLNRFIQYMRNTPLLFRNASGTFYNDRWKPIAEGIANLILSLAFVWLFPEELRVVGVIVATILTNLVICDTVEPYVIFKHVFGESPKGFYRRNYAFIALFAAALYAMTFLTRERSGPVAGILVNGLLSLAVSAAVLLTVCLLDKAFRRELRTMCRKAVGWTRARLAGGKESGSR